MGGDSKEECERKEKEDKALKHLQRLLQETSNNDSDTINNINNNNNNSNSSISNINTNRLENENIDGVLERFLHMEKTGLSYKFNNNNNNNNNNNKRSKNVDQVKTNNFISAINKRRNKNTKAYTRFKKRKEITYLGKFQLIGIALSILLSITLCFFGVKVFIAIVPNFQRVSSYIMETTIEWIAPNSIPKETNLNDNVLSMTVNITANVFFDDYLQKKKPLLFKSETFGEGLRKEIMNLIEKQYKHTPVAVSDIEKVARERLIPSAVAITTYSAKSKLSDIRRLGRFDSKSDENLIVFENIFQNGRMPKILKSVSSSLISLPECINSANNQCRSNKNISIFSEYQQNEIYLSYSLNATGMNFHHHKQGWHFLLKGRMKWVIFPPDMISGGGFDPKTDNLKKWMTEVYVKLKKSQRPYFCNQKEGEILFIPEGFYYATITSTKESISISQVSSFEDAGSFFSYKIDGLKRFRAGDYKGALTSYSLGSKVLSDFSLFYDQALCHEALAHSQLAEAAYKQALIRNPRYSAAYEKLIQLYLRNTSTEVRHKEAKNMLDDAISQNIVNNNKVLMDLQIEIEKYE